MNTLMYSLFGCILEVGTCTLIFVWIFELFLPDVAKIILNCVSCFIYVHTHVCVYTYIRFD